tara:strand:- start:598 stop:1206 length:609 start_codon:yes stop_codon:yes gene_type:complete
MIDKIKILDHATLNWIHKYLSNPILDRIMPFITNEDNWIIPILFLIVFLCTGAQKKGRITLFLLIVSLSLTDIICAQYIKPFIERVRPSHLDLEGINLLVKKGGKWSMPSNHSANMFAFSVILSYFYNRYKPLLFSLACAIAFSRVYVGVHFPGDVIIGGVIGYMISWFVLSLWIRLKLRELKKGKVWVWYETYDPEFKKIS